MNSGDGIFASTHIEEGVWVVSVNFEGEKLNDSHFLRVHPNWVIDGMKTENTLALAITWTYEYVSLFLF